MRDRSLRRLGTVLAGLGLYLQLAFAGFAALTLAAPADPVEALAGHALCLAGDPNAPAPGDSGPAAPKHDHFAFCCLWHAPPGLTAQAARAPLPVAYAAVAPVVAPAATLPPGPHHSPANARAPPTV